MKSIGITLLLLLITLSGVIGYSYLYKDLTIKERVNKKSVVSVQVEKTNPIIIDKIILPNPEPIIEEIIISSENESEEVCFILYLNYL